MIESTAENAAAKKKVLYVDLNNNANVYWQFNILWLHKRENKLAYVCREKYEKTKMKIQKIKITNV